ncbi:hypothetical protein PsorP6_010231 [Peronosclerospora sorghi]|uniref:Uncharacterized protein n=1 Tax=Peronosclerospora sorghi TaxID=230839 RepID=A0ACC0VVB9_9STRA|nr:hypothetical protein PsorP6_010231 [Peronosclerospora sorghi]
MAMDHATSINAFLANVFLGVRRNLLQTMVLVLLVLGAFSMLARIVDVSVRTSGTSQSESRMRGLNLSQIPVEQLTHPPIPLVQRIAPPHKYSSNETKELCYKERDVGIITAVQQSEKTFCAGGGWDSQVQAPVSLFQATQVAIYNVRGGLRSSTFRNLMVDLVNVTIHAPIQSIAEDGGHHDPRFMFNMRIVNCACDELYEYFLRMPGNRERRAEQIWHNLLAKIPPSGVPVSTVCPPNRLADAESSRWDFVKSPTKATDNYETVVFEEPVVVIARRDDHNPFFQISAALNSWIMLKALSWDITKTRVIHFDAGYPSPIDELHQKLLAPNHEIVRGSTLMGKRVHFRGDALFAGFESFGPMMEHLNDNEPCYESELMKTFRAQSLLALNVTPEVEREQDTNAVRPMIVTVITRRPYQGRPLQRKWLNEDEVMMKMRVEYKGLNVELRSIDYVNLTVREQMIRTVESDIIIGMHGAGLVNVLWARPLTKVIEIFPKKKFRWGYRNLCQFTGCNWTEFRGGEDFHRQMMDKRIPYPEWMAFFDPILRQSYAEFQEQQTKLREAL